MIKYFHISRSVKDPQSKNSTTLQEATFLCPLRRYTGIFLCGFSCLEGLFLQLALLLGPMHNVVASLFLNIIIAQWFLEAELLSATVYIQQRCWPSPVWTCIKHLLSSFLQHHKSLTGAHICHCSRTDTNLPGAEGNLSLCVYAIQGSSHILRK